MAASDDVRVGGRVAFRSILCVIHSGAANNEAVAQAELLAGPQTDLSFLAIAGGEHDGGEEAEALAAELGVRESVRIDRGANPSRALLDASAGADLLVIAGPGDARPGNVVLGSTASSAVHAAELPVLVARRPPEGRSFPCDILVSTDGSPDSRRGVELGGRVAVAHDSRIALVHVSERRSQPHRAVVEDAVALGKEVGVEPATIEEFGNPADQVAEVARRERVSLLVVGSRGLGGARRLGSVGERLAHEARCSVLVARPS